VVAFVKRSLDQTNHPKQSETSKHLISCKIKLKSHWKKINTYWLLNSHWLKETFHFLQIQMCLLTFSKIFAHLSFYLTANFDQKYFDTFVIWQKMFQMPNLTGRQNLTHTKKCRKYLAFLKFLFNFGPKYKGKPLISVKTTTK